MKVIIYKFKIKFKLLKTKTKMCGRVIIGRNSRYIVRAMKLNTQMQNDAKYNSSYNISPGQYLPCVYHNKENALIIEAMKWGASLEKLNNIIFNSRNETINIYSFYSQFSRCVVIIQGYYEWLNKQPYFITSQTFNYKNELNDESTINEGENDLMYLAGLYIQKTDEDGFDYKEISIITKNSQKDIQFIHHRMPVILSSLKEVNDYLSGDVSLDKIVNRSVELKFYEVGDLVNKLANTGKENIIPKEDMYYNKNGNYLIKKFLSGNKNIIKPKKNNLNLINTIQIDKKNENNNSDDMSLTLCSTVPETFCDNSDNKKNNSKRMQNKKCKEKVKCKFIEKFLQLDKKNKKV